MSIWVPEYSKYTCPESTWNSSCHIPPPSAKECSQIPICSEEDHIAYLAAGSICSTSVQTTSCLAGFMYFDGKNLSGKPPFPFAYVDQVRDKDLAGGCSCYQNFPYTRACCPGYYCPAGMYCMMPCSKGGSYCPSSDTNFPPNCMISVMDEQNIVYHEIIGCGGAYHEDSLCPAGSYCPNSTHIVECPKGFSCRQGSFEPRRCSFLQGCPKGTVTPQNDTVSASLFTIAVLIVIICLIFYDKLRTYGLIAFHLLYQKVYNRDFDEMRVERNKTKKKNVSTLFSSSRNLNFKPYKTLDAKEFNESLLAMEMQEQAGTLPDSTRMSVMSTTSSMSDYTVMSGDEDDEKNCKMHFRQDIEFKNLSLHLKANDKTILEECSGKFQCGTVNAIMGPSGAGKTSFLFTLCGKARSYGKISGDILINGQASNIQYFKDIVGFVPQSDAMTAEMTVKEMLHFNSKYRLSSDVSHHYQKSIVRDVMKLLKIKRIRHSYIGDDVKRGVSGGQKKRVNIGMELVSQPSVIFLDEPTSGLDSTTSNDVMEVLRLIAGRGTLVLVVLHQPRYEIFNAFDNIVLLAEGGKMVYMGDTQNAMPYFEQFGYVKPNLVNPADFMMDVISGTTNPVDKAKPDLVQKWKEMDREKTWPMKINSDFSNNLMNQKHKDNALYKPRKKLSFFHQILMCTERAVTVSWRQKSTLTSDIMMIAFMGFIVGYISDTDSFGGIGSNIFNLVITSNIIGCIVSLRLFGNDREMYWRFSSSGINRFSYFLGQTIASAPWLLLQPLFYLFLYWPMANPRGSMSDYYIMLCFGMFCSQGIGHLISIVVDPKKSILVSVVIVIVFCFLCGFNPTLNSFNSVMKIVSDMSYARWQQEALWMKEINAWPEVFETKRKEQSMYLGYSTDDDQYWKNAFLMVCIGVIFRAVTFFVLVYVNRAKQM